jgi:hypothetical protein
LGNFLFVDNFLYSICDFLLPPCFWFSLSIYRLKQWIFYSLVGIKIRSLCWGFGLARLKEICNDV